MDTRKYIKLAAGVSIFLVSGVAFASHYSSEAEKFFERTCTKTRQFGINAFVCDLRERIDNIQLIPGPQGPPGPKGGTGAVGPQGPPGAGQIMKIFDANGIELGPQIGQWDFYSIPLDRLIHIETNGRITAREHDFHLYFTTSNCTGTVYFFPGDYKIDVHKLFYHQPTDRYYVLDRNTPIETKSICTTVRPTETTCRSASNGVPGEANCVQMEDMVEMTLVSNPHPNPVSLPLRYVIE